MGIWDIAAQGAGTVVGAGLGLALGGIDRKNQIKQQQKLQNMQIAGQKEMGEFNRQQQMQMWEDTNYGAQMGQLKQAGLNPGLIYGMGGGGGATTAANTGSVSGGQAASSAGAQGMAMQGAQMQLLAAQTRKANAEAEATETGIPNIGKVGTGIDLDNEMKEINNEIAQYTKGNAKSMSDQQLTELRQNVQILLNERDISDATKGAKIQSEWNQLLQNWLDIELTKSNIGLTNDKRVALAQDVQNSITALEQKAYELEQGNRRLDQTDVDNAIKQQLADWQTSYGRLAAEAGIDLLGKAADALKNRGGKSSIKTGAPLKTPLKRFTKSQMRKDVLK